MYSLKIAIPLKSLLNRRACIHKSYNSSMNNFTRDSYGFHAPSRFIARLISLAQGCPHNWIGRQLALILRKLVLILGTQPIDTAIGNIRLRSYLNDNVSERKFVFLPWLYDQAERDFISENLPADGVFIDIGANIGIYTLWACQYLSSKGKVLAIEPNPVVFDRLRFNLEANRVSSTDWPQVRTMAVAVGDREAVVDLNLDRSNLGGSSLVSHPDSEDKIQVSSRPLLTLLSICGINRIDIMKVDIEGAEDIALMPFLENAAPALLPRIMIIENSEHLWQSDLVATMKKRDYQVVLRTRMNTIYRLTRT